MTAPAAAAAAGADGGYSADTLYNAANAYARAGNTGLAVLYYERAELLAPADPDIAANLHFVRSVAQLPDAPRGAFEQQISKLAPPDALAWLGVLGLSCIGAAVLGRGSIHRALRGLLIGVGAASLCLVVANAVVMWPRLQAGVVLAADTPLRAAPAPLGDELLPMREGEIVRIEAQHEDFLLVRTGQGREGWVARAGVAPVLPPEVPR